MSTTDKHDNFINSADIHVQSAIRLSADIADSDSNNSYTSDFDNQPVPSPASDDVDLHTSTDDTGEQDSELIQTRKKPRRKQVFYDTAQAERVAITGSHEDDVIDIIDIQRAINGLSNRQRQVYMMTMSGKTREDIAALFKLTPRRIGQIQAEIYATIDHALAIRLPGQSNPSQVDDRQR